MLVCKAILWVTTVPQSPSLVQWHGEPQWYVLCHSHRHWLLQDRRTGRCLPGDQGSAHTETWPGSQCCKYDAHTLFNNTFTATLCFSAQRLLQFSKMSHFSAIHLFLVIINRLITVFAWLDATLNYSGHEICTVALNSTCWLMYSVSLNVYHPPVAFTHRGMRLNAEINLLANSGLSQIIAGLPYRMRRIAVTVSNRANVFGNGMAVSES